MYIRKSDRLMRSAALAALLLSSGFVSADVSDEEFTIARMAIEEAQEVDADTSASSELTLAERKYQSAVENDDEGRDEVAERLLHQARLHAEHAEVEALLAQADTAHAELNAALSSLENELRRR